MSFTLFNLFNIFPTIRKREINEIVIVGRFIFVYNLILKTITQGSHFQFVDCDEKSVK